MDFELFVDEEMVEAAPTKPQKPAGALRLHLEGVAGMRRDAQATLRQVWMGGWGECRRLHKVGGGFGAGGYTF